MTTAFAAAVLSAICYGVAATLQSWGARLVPTERQAGARSLVRVLRQWPFLAGTLLDVCGFGAQMYALRVLPLFVVQATLAGNLAVTALVSIPILGIRLGGRQWTAVFAVCAGLALLGASSGTEGAAGTGLTTRFALLAAAVVLGAAGLAAVRLEPPHGPIVQGVVAGLGFGLAAACVRAMPSVSVGSLVRDPAVYAAAISGVCAFWSFTAGLQRGVVTIVSATVILGETALPAAVGVAFWHDRTREGWAPAAFLGFALAVAGALFLARFADPDREPGSAPDQAAAETADRT